MSRTWRRDDSGRKNHGDNRRNKRREKANSHYSDNFDVGEEYRKWCDNRGRKTNSYYDLDTDED